jgi:hypothetical protein
MGKYVVLGVGGVVLAGCVALVVFVWGLYTDEVCAHIGGLRGVTDRLGTVTACDSNLSASEDIKDMDTFVFDIAGDKGTGRVYVKSTPDGPDGTEVYTGILLVCGDERVLVDGTEEPPTR